MTSRAHRSSQKGKKPTKLLLGRGMESLFRVSRGEQNRSSKTQEENKRWSKNVNRRQVVRHEFKKSPPPSPAVISSRDRDTFLRARTCAVQDGRKASLQTLILKHAARTFSDKKKLVNQEKNEVLGASRESSRGMVLGGGRDSRDVKRRKNTMLMIAVKRSEKNIRNDPSDFLPS